jgi:hypothetical protein
MQIGHKSQLSWAFADPRMRSNFSLQKKESMELSKSPTLKEARRTEKIVDWRAF